MPINSVTPSYYTTPASYGKPAADNVSSVPERDVDLAAQEAAEQGAALAAAFEESSRTTVDANELLQAMAEEYNPILAALKSEQATFQMSTSSSTSDKSSELLQRLVAAAGQFEVRQVLADAVSELITLKLSAAMATGDEKNAADAAIRKIERLISRGRKKIDKLNEEDALHRQHVRAQEQKQRARAEQIKAELRKRKLVRKAQENNYLLEEMFESLAASGVSDKNTQLDAATEAEITAQAEAQAAAEFAAGSGGADVGGMGGADAAVSGGGDVAVEGGGEIAVDAGGGEASGGE